MSGICSAQPRRVGLEDVLEGEDDEAASRPDGEGGDLILRGSGRVLRIPGERERGESRDNERRSLHEASVRAPRKLVGGGRCDNRRPLLSRTPPPGIFAPMSRLLRALVWIVIAAVGAAAFAWIALEHDEPVNAAWLLTAAVCTLRGRLPLLQPKFIAAKVFALDATRRHAGGAPRATGATSCRRTSGSSSATTSRRSPGRARWSGRRSPRSSASCPARSGSSSASCSAAPCRTS